MNQVPPELNPPSRILMGPGPSDIPPRVLQAMARQFPRPVVQGAEQVSDDRRRAVDRTGAVGQVRSDGPGRDHGFLASLASWIFSARCCAGVSVSVLITSPV